MKKGIFIYSWLGFIALSFDVRADLPSDRILVALKAELAKTYGQAKIEFLNQVRWINVANAPGAPAKVIQSVSILEDDLKGSVHFLARGNSEEGPVEGWVSFAAWMPAQVALRRLHPNEKLSPEFFSNQMVNVAAGQAREFRGVILSPSQGLAIDKLETIQTILEGQFLVSTAVRHLPDVRRGEPVRIHLRSGELVLTTQGFAEEPGYISRQLKVMTQRGKRQLMGKLKADGVVEVNL